MLQAASKKTTILRILNVHVFSPHIKDNLLRSIYLPCVRDWSVTTACTICICYFKTKQIQIVHLTKTNIIYQSNESSVVEIHAKKANKIKNKHLRSLAKLFACIFFIFVSCNKHARLLLIPCSLLKYSLYCSQYWLTKSVRKQ